MPRLVRNSGATLVELVFTLGLLCLLAGLAAPGFQTTLRAAAVRAATLELLSGLQQVRVSAIFEGRPGRLCPVDEAGGCLAAATPGKAWRSFLDGATPREVGGQVLPPGVFVRATRSPLRFWPQGSAASTGTLTICDVRGIALPRAIVVSQLGRARVAAAPVADCPS